MSPEIWKAIPGFEGKYEVSNLGRVRAIPHRVRGMHKSGTRFMRVSPGRILRPGRYKSGHVSVAIGRGNNRLVHQLVLEAFVGPCPEGCEVLHLNGVPNDNRLENLKYGTRSENLKMDYDTGVRKLTPEHWERMYKGRNCHKK